MKTLYLFFAVLLLLPCVFSRAEAQPTLEARTIVSDLDTPWEVSWGPDGWLWFTERPGTISRVDPETGELQKLLTIAEVSAQGEGGLLGMALYENGTGIQVYVLYTYRLSPEDIEYQGKVVRYDYDGTSLVNPVTIINGFPASGNHTGSRLRIIDGKLFITYGDASVATRAQDLGSLGGKILRVNPDGSVPADNPFPDAEFPASLIWSWGHRNPQGLVMGPNGILYSSEHGPQIEDEVNIIEKGRNYGWPAVNGYCDTPEEEQFCLDSNVAEPIASWTPTLAVCGLEFYDGDRFPAWKNSLLMVTLKEQELRQMKLGADGRMIVEQNVYLDERWGRLRDVCVSPDGRVFIATNLASTLTNVSDGIIELYYREEPLPNISGIEFDTELLCAWDKVPFRFSVDAEFEPDNLFRVGLVNPADPEHILRVLTTIPGTTGAEFTLSDLSVLRGGHVRVISTNPYVSGEIIGPLDVYLPPATYLRTSSGRPLLCEEGETLELSVQNATPDARFKWSTGSTDPTIMVSDTGTYSVELTWPNGCPGNPMSLRIMRGQRPDIRLDAEQTEYTLCAGDSLLLTAKSEDTPALIRWSNGVVNTTALWVKTSGKYWVSASNDIGCTSYSDTVNVTVRERPFKPEILRTNNILACSPAAYYQWYRDGEQMNGETGQLLTVTKNGIYWVEVSNTSGCINRSDSIEMIVTGVGEDVVAGNSVQVYPQPVEDQMWLEFAAPVRELLVVSLTDMSGREVRRFRESPDGTKQKMFSLSDLPSGSYLLRVETGSAVTERVIVKR